MTRWRRRCAWGGVALAAFLPSCTGVAGPVTARHAGGHVLTGPANARDAGELFGVSVVSSGDVWAVGVAKHVGGSARTPVERWRARAARPGPTPDPGSGGS